MAKIKDIKIAATDVCLAAAKDWSALTIVGDVVATTPKGPKRTANAVHLTLSAQQAMRLLAMLQVVQSMYKHVDPVTETAVPPAKDRN
jgi:hypothetical protein